MLFQVPTIQQDTSLPRIKKKVDRNKIIYNVIKVPLQMKCSQHKRRKIIYYINQERTG